MNYKLLATALCFALLPFFADAQTWQWAKQGGDITDGVNSVPFETVWDMVTDPNGNVYTLSIIEGSSLPKVDGHAISPYDKKDLLLSSFTCDGQYRWSKHLGGWNDEHAGIYWQRTSLKTDNAGRVYVAGRIGAQLTAPNPTRFDTDTVLPSTSKKFAFLIQYDTAGNFQWLRMPEPDTATRIRVIVHDMDLDSAGNAYVLVTALPGKLADGSFVIAADGWYILKYTTQGTLVSVTPLPAQFPQNTGIIMRMARSKTTGNFVLTGFKDLNGTLVINGTSVFYGFVASYSSTGNFRWLSTGSTSIDTRAEIDRYDNVYIAGSAPSNIAIFNNYYTANGFSGGNAVPYVIKLDSSGKTIWGKNGASPASAYGTDIGLYNNRLYLTGHYADVMSFAGYPKTLNHAPGQNYDIYLASLSLKDGSILSLDTLASQFGAEEAASELAFDKRNNIYVGGYIHSGTLTVGSSTLTKYGGYSDFLLTKFGYNNCNCATPTAAYSYTLTNATNTGNFSYTGTGAYDSLQWDFGDGSYSNAAAPTHKFASNGSYLVCVTAFTQCGSSTTCQGITVTSVEDAPFHTASVYPNPAKDELVVDGLGKGITLSLQDIYGKQVYHGVTGGSKTVVSLSTLPHGIYLLNMIAPDGRRQVQKIVKE